MEARDCDVHFEWALIFFVISLVAGAFGMSGLAAGAKRVAMILFAVFLVLALVVVLLAVMAGQAIF